MTCVRGQVLCTSASADSNCCITAGLRNSLWYKGGTGITIRIASPCSAERCNSRINASFLIPLNAYFPWHAPRSSARRLCSLAVVQSVTFSFVSEPPPRPPNFGASPSSVPDLRPISACSLPRIPTITPSERPTDGNSLRISILGYWLRTRLLCCQSAPHPRKSVKVWDRDTISARKSQMKNSFRSCGETTTIERVTCGERRCRTSHSGGDEPAV